MFDALQADPPVSVRINPLKPVDVGGSPIPWCVQGRFLDHRPVFTLDPLYHAGCYYVQEASSMLLEQALIAAGLPERPVLALDLCASPGGKSTHLLSLLPAGSVLVSNEAVRSRQGALIENLLKWGAPNSIITGSPTTAFSVQGARFDLVVIDAPCSGEGMFRKDPFARAQWSPRLVQECAMIQSAILDDAWACLAPGGTLIYSTCTWDWDENEAHIERLIEGSGAVPITIPASEAATSGSGPGIRCYPHRSIGEGFFIAAVRKPDEGSSGRSEPLEAVAERLRAAGIRVLFPGGDTELDRFAEVLQAGSAIGPALELDMNGSLGYLRGEALRADDATGMRTVTHRGFALGLVKGAGNRWNNLHPKPWRIRMR